MQTGTQLIAGFLLTLPFTARFGSLDTFEENLYLGLVLLAGLTLALLLTPVAIHRRLFGEHVKGRLVTAAHRLMVVALASVGLLITGNITLIFHVVVGATAAFVVGGLVLLVVTGLLLVVPMLIHPRAGRASGASRRSTSARSSRSRADSGESAPSGLRDRRS